MLSAELKVNGVTVVHIYGHNKGYRDTEDTTKNVYYWEVVEFGHGKFETGIVSHRRSEGLAALVQKILQAYGEQDERLL